MVEQLIKNQINVKDEMINKLHNELDYYKREQPTGSQISL